MSAVEGTQLLVETCPQKAMLLMKKDRQIGRLSVIISCSTN